MKVFVGITQDPQATLKNIGKNYKKVVASAEVGPFGSSVDASKWMEYMIDHMGNYEKVGQSASPVVDKLWYGLTVECAVS